MTANITGMSITSEALCPAIWAVCGMLKGGQCHRYAAHQHQIEQVSAHNIAQRKSAMALDQRGNGGDQFRQGSAQRHKGQCNDRFRYPKRLGDPCAIVHQQVGANGDQYRACHQQQQFLGKRLGFSCRLLRCGSNRFGGHLPHRCDHINRKQSQQNQAGNPAEIPGGVGDAGVKQRGKEKERYRCAQAFGVDFAGPYSDGERGDQGGVADYRSNGVAVSDLAVSAQCRGGGYHDLRQGSTDGHYRGADQQFGQMKTAGNTGSAIHKPVAAFNQADQPYAE